MQTFVPSSEGFEENAKLIDNKRLGKQRVETLQIINTLLDPQYGWRHHPAVFMWSENIPSLCDYGVAVCKEWINRGMKDNILPQINALKELAKATGSSTNKPDWWGNEKIHESHRSNLLAKYPEYYSNIFKNTEPGLDYIWPVKEMRIERCFPSCGPMRINILSNFCECTETSFEAIRTRRGTREPQGAGTWWRCVQCLKPNEKWLEKAQQYLQDHYLSVTSEVVKGDNSIKELSKLSSRKLVEEPEYSLLNNQRYFVWR